MSNEIKLNIPRWLIIQLVFVCDCIAICKQAILDAKATAVWINKNNRPVRIPQEFFSKFADYVGKQQHHFKTEQN